MIDIHSHIINGIDDGAKTLEESIAILKKMHSLGINGVIATPHFINSTSYVADNLKKSYLLGQIKENLRKENINIDLYLGNEIFIDKDINNLIKSSKVATINGSQYILIEFPRNIEMLALSEILFDLRNKKYIPIIAHPERYLFLQKDYSLLNQFLEMGCLFQGNIENVAVKYGRDAAKLFWYMLNHNKYQFLATDIHHENDTLFTNFSKIEKKLIDTIGIGTYQILTDGNPNKILKNEKVVCDEIMPVVKKFGGWK